MAEFGVGLHPEFGLVEAHLLGFLVDPQADRVLQDQPDGRAGHHHEDADRDDADDLRPQSAAEDADREGAPDRSEEHTSELQSLMRISYAVFCLKKKNKYKINNTHIKTDQNTE